MAKLADVDQPLNARLELHKCAEIHEPRNGPLGSSTRRVLLRRILPGTRANLAVGQPNFAGLLVEFIDANFNFLTDFEHFARVLHSIPTELTYMNQAIQSAEIDECAEVFEASYNTLANLPRSEFGN